MRRRWGEKSRSSSGGYHRPALRAFLLTAGLLVWSAGSAFAADCTNPAAPEGSIVYGTTDHVLAFCNGTGWVSVGGGGDGGAADNLGDHTATADLDLATNKIINLATPTASGDAATKAYVDALSGADNLGNHTATANLVMGAYWLSGDGGNEGLAVDASGKVGVGTSAPGAVLDVSLGRGGASNAIRLLDAVNSNAPRGSWSLDASGHTLIQLQNTIGTTTAQIATDSGRSTYFNHGGNVGIGTGSPGQQLATIGVIASGEGTASDTDGRTAMAWIGGSDYGVISSYQAGYKPLYLDAAPAIFNQGNVGIGTTSPAALLDVNGGQAYIHNTSASLPALHVRATGGAPVAIFGDTGGNVGIGTTSPVGLLHVGAGADAMMISSTAVVQGSGTTNLGVRNATSDVELLNYVAATEAHIGTATNHRLNIRTNNTDRITILSAGNVGVGTTAPAYKLDVNGAVNATSVLVNGVAVGAGGTQWASGAGGVISYAGGNVGIGTTTPGALFHVFNPTTGALAQIQTGGTNAYAQLNLIPTGTGLAYFGYGTAAGSNLQFYSMKTGVGDVMRIDGDGKVGIGTTSPSGQLEIKSAASTHNALYLNTTTAAAWANSILFQEAGVTKAGIQYHPGVLAGGMLFNTKGGGGSPDNTSMAIDSNGNVGIGTTSPLDKFVVNGNPASQWTARFVAGSAVNDSYGVKVSAGTGASDVALLVTNQANSATYLAVRGDGNVGIGTTNPGATLSVTGGNSFVNIGELSGSATYGGIAFGSASGAVTTGNYSLLGQGIHTYLNRPLNGDMYFRENNVDHMTIKTGGNVGIGTTSPGARLELQNSTVQDSLHSINTRASGGNAHGIRAEATGANTGSSNIGGYFFASGATNNFAIRTASGSPGAGASNWSLYSGSEAQSYFAGNVGIGTATPGEKLEVNGNILVTAAGTAGAPSIRINEDNGGLFSPTGDTLAISTAGVERLRIDAAGNVGIGTTSPGAKLTVVGGGSSFDTSGALGGAENNSYSISPKAGTDLGFLTDGNGTAGRKIILNYYGGGPQWRSALEIANTNSATYGNLLLMQSGGRVGIGTMSPGASLHVKEAGYDRTQLTLQDSDGACDLNPESGSLTINCSSDERLKRDIVSAPPQLGYLAGIPIRQYVVKASGDTMIGVIAQELLKNGHGELVSEGDDSFYTVSELSSWRLVKAIQELDAQNKALRAEAEADKKAAQEQAEAARFKVDALEKRLVALEARLR